jgi:hypothetical protein
MDARSFVAAEHVEWLWLTLFLAGQSLPPAMISFEKNRRLLHFVGSRWVPLWASGRRP